MTETARPISSKESELMKQPSKCVKTVFKLFYVTLNYSRIMLLLPEPYTFNTKLFITKTS